MATKKVKKDFDKERMYAKIMPTVFTEPVQLPVVPEPDDEYSEEFELQQFESADAPSQPKEWPEQLERVEHTAEPPMPEPEYILRNYMEDIILEKYLHTMKMLKACACEKCKKDIMAHALNMLPSSYMAIRPDMVDGMVRELRASLEVKVSTALIQAVQHVKANPQHE